MHRGMSIDKRAAQANNPVKGLKRLLSYLKPYRLQLVIVTVLVIISTGLNVLNPYLIGLTIDRALIQLDLRELLRMVIILLSNYLISWLLHVLYGQIMAETAQKAMRNMRQGLFDHMQKLSISYYDKQQAGDLLSRLTNDMDAINQLLSQNFTSFIQSFSSLVGTLIMMFALSLSLTLAALIVIPLSLVVTRLIMKRSRPAFQNLQKTLGDLNSLMEEDIGGQRVIIAYGQQGRSLVDFKVRNQTVKDAGIKANILAVAFLRNMKTESLGMRPHLVFAHFPQRKKHPLQLLLRQGEKKIALILAAVAALGQQIAAVGPHDAGIMPRGQGVATQGPGGPQ